MLQRWESTHKSLSGKTYQEKQPADYIFSVYHCSPQPSDTQESFPTQDSEKIPTVP